MRCSAALLLLASAAAAADPLSLRVDCSAGASPGALSPFWRSVGYTPAEYALRDDELENTAHIGAVPHRGVAQVRIHYLLDLLVLRGSVPGAGTPSTYALDVDFRALDHALDFLVASGLSPGFELMGSPAGFPQLPMSFWTPYSGNGKLLPNATLAMWRQLIADTLAHAVARYGAAEVQAWNLESWNEPDRGWGWPDVTSPDDPVLAAYVQAWDAAAAGVADAEAATGAKLRFGGTASGGAADDAFFLPAILDRVASGAANPYDGRPPRLDYITAHIKGKSTSYVTVVGEWAVSALIRSKPAWVAAGLGALAVSNDEGDPMVGWETPEDWRGDARYAAIIPKMVNQHLLAIGDNRTGNNPLGLLSFDGAFINGASDTYTGFGERTMTARFGAQLSGGPFAFVRKSGLAAFALLARLGDARCAVAGAPADVLGANAGALAATRAAAGGEPAQAALLVYNSADCGNDTAPDVALAATLTGLPFAPAPADGTVVAVRFRLDQDAAHNPAAAWAAMGSPPLPAPAQLAALWAAAAAMTAADGAPTPVAVAAGGAVTLPAADVALPGITLWHLADRRSAPAAPQPPPAVDAFVKAANASLLAPGSREVFVRWACANASRATLAYVVQVSAAGPAGPWTTVNAPPFPADISCSFAFAATPAQAEGAYYRVAAVDYWQRMGPFSTPTAAVPWRQWG